jgi:hypothetical protein
MVRQEVSGKPKLWAVNEESSLGAGWYNVYQGREVVHLCGSCGLL